MNWTSRTSSLRWVMAAARQLKQAGWLSGAGSVVLTQNAVGVTLLATITRQKLQIAVCAAIHVMSTYSFASHQPPHLPHHTGQAAELLKAYVASSSDSSKPVVELACPDKLAAAFAAAGVPLKLDDHQAAAETSNELIGTQVPGGEQYIAQHHRNHAYWQGTRSQGCCCRPRTLHCSRRGR